MHGGQVRTFCLCSTRLTSFSSLDEIEAMMNNLSMPAGQQGFGGSNLLGDVSNVLNDIESETNSLNQLENSLDSILDPNSTYIRRVNRTGVFSNFYIKVGMGNVDPFTGGVNMNQMAYGSGGMQGYGSGNSYDQNMGMQGMGMNYGSGDMGMQGAMTGPMTGPGFVNNQPAMPPVGRGEQMATVDAMGRQVIWEGPPCNRCGQQVIGKVFATLGKNYHPECFTCTYCNDSFQDGKFMQHEDDPYCERCYNNLMATKCATCQMPITDTAIQASGKMYHPHHFVCSGCGTGLQGQEYKDGQDGEPYCTECAKSRARLIGELNTI